MTIPRLPSELAKPVIVSERVAFKVMQDITVYLRGPSEHELEFLVDLYESLCPSGRLVKYKIAELEFWPRIAVPVSTLSVRAAMAAGVKRPYLEPSRNRIRQGRAFEVQFWDGKEIEDPDDSWMFGCRRIHLRSKGLFAFARIILPLNADSQLLHKAALAIAENVELYSGHGGLVFIYNTWLKEPALDGIYSLARRFWGVDVEDLNDSLPLMKQGIKSVNWITLVGREFASRPDIQTSLTELAKAPNVTIDQRKYATVLIAGAQPVEGDQHRPDKSLDPYYAVAKALEPLFIKAHPDFSSERWVENGNTIGWIRRFIDPAGWR